MKLYHMPVNNTFRLLNMLVDEYLIDRNSALAIDMAKGRPPAFPYLRKKLIWAPQLESDSTSPEPMKLTARVEMLEGNVLPLVHVDVNPDDPASITAGRETCKRTLLKLLLQLGWLKVPR
jgi:hypothetical protein